VICNNYVRTLNKLWTLFSYLGFSHKGEFLRRYVFNKAAIALNNLILYILVCFNCIYECISFYGVVLGPALALRVDRANHAGTVKKA
jgi:hypothetical protein